MDDHLLIHPATESALNSYLSRPSHGLLISGGLGAGKTALANYVAGRLLGYDAQSLTNYPHFITVKRPEYKQSILINQIRAVKTEAALKIPGRSLIRRVIYIEDAHSMNDEAQNALLKSLEEPSDYTIFILSTVHKDRLLPTIASRLTEVAVKPVSLAEAKDYFDNPSDEVEAAWQLARGLPGLIVKLLREDSNELRQAVVQAKELLSKDKLGRLIMLDKLSNNRQEFALFLEGLARTIQALYKSAVKKDSRRQAKALVKSMQAVLDCQSATASSASPRLAALRLALNLSV